MSAAKSVRSLVLVLGDQLDAESSALDGFDPHRDVIWMAEVAEESEHVWTSKPKHLPARPQKRRNSEHSLCRPSKRERTP